MVTGGSIYIYIGLPSNPHSHGLSVEVGLHNIMILIAVKVTI